MKLTTHYNLKALELLNTEATHDNALKAESLIQAMTAAVWEGELRLVDAQGNAESLRTKYKKYFIDFNKIAR